MEVIAEGVENEEQFNFLRSRHCHFAQADCSVDAMSAEDFLALVIQQESGRVNVHTLFA